MEISSSISGYYTGGNSSLASVDAKRVPTTEVPQTSQDISSVEPEKNNTAIDKNSQLSDAEKKQVDELLQRDREVKAHEQAHQSAGSSIGASAASFEYQTGPDGKRYAVGGEVSIDVSKVAGDPQATIVKAQQIRRAALAPADPSTQDRQVAAQASKMELEARKELQQQKQSQSTTESNSPIFSKEAFQYEQVQSYANTQNKLKSVWVDNYV